MINQVKAKIFLGAERGLTETNWFRTRNLFNAGKYIAPHRQNFEDIYLFNEETVAPQRSIAGEMLESSLLLILPVWGGIKYTGNGHMAYHLQPGELFLVPAPAKHMYSVGNTEEKENVQFIQIAVRTEAALLPKRPFHLSMSTDDYKNQLHQALSFETTDGFELYLGQFSGRKKGEITWPEYRHSFAFLLQGALEMEDRLLHEGDALGMWQTRQLEWEALSAQSLFLLLTFPGR